MKNFSLCYRAEMYKNSKRAAYLKLGIALVVVLLFATLIFSFINKLGALDGNIVGDGSETVTEEQALALWESRLSEYKASNPKFSFFDNTLYQMEANVAKYRYLVANNLSEGNYEALAAMGNNARGFVMFALAFIESVVFLYVLIRMSMVTEGEAKNGTLKIELTHRRSRHALLSAKYASIMTEGVVAYVAGVIVALVIGVIMCGAQSKSVLIVLDAHAAGVISPMAALTLTCVSDLIVLAALAAMSLFVSSALKAGVWLPIVIYLIGGGVEQILGFIGLNYVTFMTNLDFTSFLTTTGLYRGGSFFLSLAMTFIWTLLFAGLAHWSFAKKDIG